MKKEQKGREKRIELGRAKREGGEPLEDTARFATTAATSKSVRELPFRAWVFEIAEAAPSRITTLFQANLFYFAYYKFSEINILVN